MRNHYFKCRRRGKWFCGLFFGVFLFQVAARADQIIYDDALQNGWQDWGWATLNYTNASPVHSGSYSISVTVAGPWQGIQLYHPAMDASSYSSLSFWLNGGNSGGQKLQVYGLLNLGGTNNFAAAPRYPLSVLAADTWQQFTVPLSSLGVAGSNNFTGFVIQDSQGKAWPTFYADDVSLVANSATPDTNAPVVITVDALANRHPISPLIYGVAWATSNELADLNSPINRAGGNAETRYNWQINAHNRGADWYFESLADSGPTNPGASDDSFVADSKNGGAQPMITISMIGWMPKLGPNRAALDSYSVARYGPQTATDPYWSDAGNGVSQATGQNITTNDPNDANFPTTVVFQQGFVKHLLNQWGPSTNGGVPFYIMDNEESIWFSTHRDIHPVGPTIQEIFNDFITYSSMVKSNDPNALVCGPEEWGWSGYLFSGYDQQWAGQHNDYNQADYPDRKANGGWDCMPWLLNQIHQHDLGTGQRLLDYFTLHCYPQEGNVSGNAVDTATELLRNQSTRVFWDSNYVDPSWINSVIMLIPRMKSWVATNYPGTKIGITEYNWGAENNINGATAQADILGIFGREGLDLATRWTVPASGSATYNAMKMYRNYDGNKSTFGDISILTTVPNPDNLSAFGAVRTSDGALTLMVINKDLNNASPITVNIANFSAAGTAERWQLTSANAINHLANLTLTNGVLSDMLPAQSITLFVLAPTNSFDLQIGDVNLPGQVGIRFNGEAGQTYTLESSADLIHWSGVTNSLLTSNSFEFLMPITNTAQTFYRGQLDSP